MRRNGSSGLAMLALLLVLSATLWLRAPSLDYPFFADDYLFLDQMRGHSLASIWPPRDPLHNYWRPLSRQGYFGFISLLGESPVAAHVLNLAAMLGIVALMYVLARRLSGPRAAIVASGVVALHEVADVPILWASGSQDLLAVAGALGSLQLAIMGRMRWAVLALLAGVLCKETVVVTPFLALWMLRVPGESWRLSLRRTLPLFLAVACWLPVWAAFMRGGTREGFRFGLGSVPAALAHLLQGFLGAQWDATAPLAAGDLLPVLIPGALVVLAIVLTARTPAGDAKTSTGENRGFTTGLLWAFLATLPVAIVVHIWSSYYYLFAVCGLSLALGAFMCRTPVWVPAAVAVMLALGSQHARRMETFATKPDPWGTQSHLSRFYFDRSMRWVSRYLQDLRAQLPSVPSRSTLYFAGTPAFASWQAGDGALARWVYGDSTIRSYYFGDFTLDRARRGEVFVFTARNDSLVRERDPIKGLLLVASGQLLSERFGTAEAAIERALDLAPSQQGLLYWRAWLRYARGDSSRLGADLGAAGCSARGAPTSEVSAAKARLAAGDLDGALQLLTRGVSRNALDPRVHAELADLLLRVAPSASGTAMETLANRLLAPSDPASWKRWAHVQVANQHAVEAYASLLHSFELAGDGRARTTEDQRLLEMLRAALPGGALAQKELRRRPAAR